jgi:O-antigen ligase
LRSTFSTTGYSVLSLIILYYLGVKSKRKLAVFLSLPLTLFVLYTAFNDLSFLRNKVEYQVEDVDFSVNKFSDFSPDRFGAFAFDLYYITKHPLIGNGLHTKTRYSDHHFLASDEDSGIWSHGNGFSNFIASMGIVAMFLILFLIFKGWPFSSLDSIFVILLVIMLLQGEQFLNYPMFLVLPFIMIPKANGFERIQNSGSYNLTQS